MLLRKATANVALMHCDHAYAYAARTSGGRETPFILERATGKTTGTTVAGLFPYIMAL